MSETLAGGIDSGSIMWDSFDHVPVGLIVLGANGLVTDANAAALALFGFSTTSEMASAHLCLATVPPDEATDTATPFAQFVKALHDPAAEDPGADNAIIEITMPVGVLALKLSKKPIAAAPTPQHHTIVSLTDVTTEWQQCLSLVTERRGADTARAELFAYKSALEQHVIVAATDKAGRITYVNQQFCDISQYTAKELLGQTLAIVNSGHHPKKFFSDMWRTIGAGQCWHGEICNRARDGGLYWVDTTIAPLRDHAGVLTGYVSLRIDITEQKRTAAALQAEVTARAEAESLLLDVIEAVPDAISAFDEEDRLVIFNSTYLDYYALIRDSIKKGVLFEEILDEGISKGQFVLPRNTPQARKSWIAARMREHLNPGRPHFQQLVDGRWLQVEERRSASGYLVGVRTDITALKEAESQVKRQAERDPLTGLLNRSVLFEQLERAVAKSAQSGELGVLAITDLDSFKAINDTLGHDVGDELLMAIGGRLTESVRKNDTIIRLGGDEFALILPCLHDERSIERLMSRLYKKVEAPLMLAGRLVHPGISMGICVFPSQGTSPTELMKNADIALYQAKARGRGRYCCFNTHMRERVEQREKIAAELRLALERGEIEVALQPQFAIADRQHVGFEALARWHHNGKDIAPSDFIPIAEEARLINQLGLQILEKSLAALALLLEKQLAPGILAVNVAAAQLKLEGFPEAVAQLLRRYNIAPQLLEIEITENVLLDRASDRIAASLTALHAMGIGIALDDFGTGHASLSHVKQFPVDRLKIDRSFVNGIGVNIDDEVIVRTIINLAHSLNKSLVAEGIETEAQLHFLQGLGCDTGQGYLVSRPLPLARAEQFLVTGISTTRPEAKARRSRRKAPSLPAGDTSMPV